MDERPYIARGMLMLLGMAVLTMGTFSLFGVYTYAGIGKAIVPSCEARPARITQPRAQREDAFKWNLFAFNAMTTMAPFCRKSEAGPASGDAKPIKVALLHPGRENDRGWNQLAYDALMALGKKPGVTVKHAFTASKSNYKSDMRAFATQDYDLVICHGGEYVKAAKDVAKDFPKTHFVVTGSDEPGEGVATLDFRLWEATYLCGMLAAMLEPAGPAGLIGGQDFRTVRYTLDAFANGAKSVKPNYETFSQYVGSWDDVAKAAQTARALIDGRKVRVIFQNCDAAAFGLFDAAADAKIFAFGSNSNQNDAKPGVVPASAVIDMHAAFEQLVDTIRAGKFEAKAITHDLKSGGIKFVPNEKLKSKWPKDAAERLAAAQRDIESGKLKVVDAKKP